MSLVTWPKIFTFCQSFILQRFFELILCKVTYLRKMPQSKGLFPQENYSLSKNTDNKLIQNLCLKTQGTAGRRKDRQSTTQTRNLERFIEGVDYKLCEYIEHILFNYIFLVSI